jgi:hypothetical protein
MIHLIIQSKLGLKTSDSKKNNVTQEKRGVKKVQKCVTYSVFHRFRESKFANQWWFDFKLEPVFDTAPATSKNEARIKSGQNRPKNNRLAT